MDRHLLNKIKLLTIELAEFRNLFTGPHILFCTLYGHYEDYKIKVGLLFKIIYQLVPTKGFYLKSCEFRDIMV